VAADSLRRGFGVLGAVSVLLAGGAWLQHVREARYPRAEVNDDTPYLSSGQAARRLTLGYRLLAADLYWIRAIQHYGSAKIRLAERRSAGTGPAAPDYGALYPLLDLTTSLDPRFIQIRRHLPGRAVSRRCGPAGSRDCTP
jgi:hypothetical protein